VKIQAAPYELPLKQPLRLGDRVIHARRGWLLRRNGAAADACPLPYFSTDALGDVEASLAQELAQPTASLSWALHALERRGEASVQTAGLAAGTEDTPGGAHACVKLKVGRRPLREELAAVTRLRQAGAQLRLDGNRALTLDAAKQLADAAGDALEFLEEPVGPSDLEDAMQQLPIALDETLAAGGPTPTGAVAFVLKPTVLGAARTLELVAAADDADIPVVVSSAYESAIGRAALIRFAAVVGPDTAHGLGTGTAFARDFTGWIRTDGDRLTACDGEVPEELPWADC